MQALTMKSYKPQMKAPKVGFIRGYFMKPLKEEVGERMVVGSKLEKI